MSEVNEITNVDVDRIQFNEAKLVPMIVQDATTGIVLSLFYANEGSFEKMKTTGYIWRYSRKLGKVIKKGEESGNCQKVISIELDCDGDALLVKVLPEGPACHTGAYSCFSKTTNPSTILGELEQVLYERKNLNSYSSSITNNKENAITKLREELEELIEADEEKELVWEAADLLFFFLTYLQNRSIKLSQVLQELRRRRK